MAARQVFPGRFIFLKSRDILSLLPRHSQRISQPREGATNGRIGPNFGLGMRRRCDSAPGPDNTWIGLAALGQPHGPAASLGIFGYLPDHVEPMLFQQPLIFRKVQARVIKRIAPVFAHRHTMLRSGVEHEVRSHFGVAGENREHLALTVEVEVEKAVPRQDAVKAAPQRYLTHIGHDPFLIGKAFLAQLDHLGGGIDAGHAHPVLHEMPCDRPAGPASKVQDRRAFDKQGNETVMPDLVVPDGPLTVPIPGVSVFLVVGANALSRCFHAGMMAKKRGKGKKPAPWGDDSDAPFRFTPVQTSTLPTRAALP